MIAIVSHDAGGAEVLSSYVRQEQLSALFVLAGPAKTIFKRKLGDLPETNLEEAIKEAEYVLAGTGWQSDLEYEAISLSKVYGKKCISFIDHWVNYPERFVRKGITCLPDEIWVGDGTALTLARRTFPSTLVNLVPNPYFKEMIEQATHLPSRIKSDSLNILYVTEPLSTHASQSFGRSNYFGYTEYDALRYLLSQIRFLGDKIHQVIIRPHPAEPTGKYNWCIQEFNLPIQIGGGVKTLLEEIHQSDVVVGCQSMAMVVGILLGKKVYCSIPHGGAPCALPHSEIIHLKDLD